MHNIVLGGTTPQSRMTGDDDVMLYDDTITACRVPQLEAPSSARDGDLPSNRRRSHQIMILGH